MFDVLGFTAHPHAVRALMKLPYPAGALLLCHVAHLLPRALSYPSPYMTDFTIVTRDVTTTAPSMKEREVTSDRTASARALELVWSTQPMELIARLRCGSLTIEIDTKLRAYILDLHGLQALTVLEAIQMACRSYTTCVDTWLIQYQGLTRIQKFYREVVIWRQMKHPYVLPLIGVDSQVLPHGQIPCIISPWAVNTHLASFVESEAFEPAKDVYRLVCDHHARRSRHEPGHRSGRRRKPWRISVRKVSYMAT